MCYLVGESKLLKRITKFLTSGLVGWALSCKVKGHRFDSCSEHTPGLWVWSLVGARTRGNRLMFLSHTDVSPSLSSSLLLSLKIKK